MNEYFENFNEPIRIFGSRLLKKKYYLRKRASDRTYHYILPLSLFYRFKNTDGGVETAKRNADDVVKMLQEVMPLLEGSHPFHSYTSYKMLGNIKIKFDPEGKKPPKADQLQRNVLGFKVEKFDQNENWLKFKIHGQSFLYNQIRCMIGVLV
jgi:tRNA pseudouridine(38-40) synthase